MNVNITMIMAGSALPWVQIRSDWSSDALNNHCLLRLQLTLLTDLPWPAYKERSKTNLEISVWLQHLLLWCGSERQTEWREEALGDPLITSTSVFLSLLPPYGNCVPRCTKDRRCETDACHAWNPVCTCRCWVAEWWQTELTTVLWVILQIK